MKELLNNDSLEAVSEVAQDVIVDVASEVMKMEGAFDYFKEMVPERFVPIILEDATDGSYHNLVWQWVYSFLEEKLRRLLECGEYHEIKDTADEALCDCISWMTDDNRFWMFFLLHTPKDYIPDRDDEFESIQEIVWQYLWETWSVS